MPESIPFASQPISDQQASFVTYPIGLNYGVSNSGAYFAGSPSFRPQKNEGKA